MPVSPYELCLQHEATWWQAHAWLPLIVRQYCGEPQRGIEVGVAFGGLSIKMTRCYPALWMIGVDAYRPYDPDDSTSEVMSNGDAVYEFARWRFANERHDRIELWRATSEEAAARVDDGSQDFVFLDADHRYDAVVADIRLWRPKVRRGGLLCGHDFTAGWPSVVRAVAENVPKVKVHEASTIWCEVVE